MALRSTEALTHMSTRGIS